MKKKRKTSRKLSNINYERKIDREIEDIENKINRLNDRLLDKVPSHFRMRDIVNAFFGSLLVGLTFVHKGALVRTAAALSEGHLIVIIISTLLILTAQIYFIGYRRVKDKKSRKFGQFWLKRLSTLYLIAIIVSAFLVYVFNINSQAASTMDLWKIIITLTMPSTIGAAIPNLLKKY